MVHNQSRSRLDFSTIFVNDDWILLYEFLLHSTLRKCISNSPLPCVERTDSIGIATGKKKNYVFSKALSYLDSLEVSSSNESEDEDNEKLKLAQIFIQPSVNYNDMKSEQ